MPPPVGRLYDDHVRQVCALPRLPEALELVQGDVAYEGEELVVEVGLLNQSVRPLRVVQITTATPGLTAGLTDATGRPVELPLDVPGRTRLQVAQGYDYDAEGTTPYRLRLTATPTSCTSPRPPAGGDGSTGVVYVDPQEPGTSAERLVFADPSTLVRSACDAP